MCVRNVTGFSFIPYYKMWKRIYKGGIMRTCDKFRDNKNKKIYREKINNT